MDRVRGSRGRGTGGYRGSSSGYSSRTFESQQHRSNVSSSDWMRNASDEFGTGKDYRHFTPTNGGVKRKYDSTQDLRKTLNNHHSNSSYAARKYEEEVSRKQFRPEPNHYSEGRSYYPTRRSEYESSSLSCRVRYHDEQNSGSRDSNNHSGGNTNSSNNHAHERRVHLDDGSSKERGGVQNSRRPPMRGSGGLHRSPAGQGRGGVLVSRGRGAGGGGRGARRPGGGTYSTGAASAKGIKYHKNKPSSSAASPRVNKSRSAASPAPLSVTRTVKLEDEVGAVKVKEEAATAATTTASTATTTTATTGQPQENVTRSESRRSSRNEGDELDRDEVELTLTEEDCGVDDAAAEDGAGAAVERKDAPPPTPAAPPEEVITTDSPASPDGPSTKPKSSQSTSPKRKNHTSSQELPAYFIQLQCPHCHQRSVTFREYISHLSGQRHAESLRKISVQHRMSLAKLRTRQRKEQQQIEAQSSRPAHASRMNFCAICKLYHSESRPNHETTELHKIIKNFLMPYCPICRVNFKSRMLYEKHVATLTHIKNKVNMEKAYERRREETRKLDRSDDNEEDLVLLNLDNYMTLDVVGSVDGDGEPCMPLDNLSIGEEFVKKVEVFYCEVCRRHLNRTEPLEKVVDLHCRSQAHHRAMEERGANDLKNDRFEEDLDQDDPDDQSVRDDHEPELKRTDSEERLWAEAEKDIGELCDIIGDDEAQDCESSIATHDGGKLSDVEDNDQLEDGDYLESAHDVQNDTKTARNGSITSRNDREDACQSSC